MSWEERERKIVGKENILMPKQLGRPRKNPAQLQTVAFDLYIYDGKPHKHGGLIKCRNNKKQMKFNNFTKALPTINAWKALQFQALRGMPV